MKYSDQGASSQYPGEGDTDYAGQLPLTATGQSSSEGISPVCDPITSTLVRWLMTLEY